MAKVLVHTDKLVERHCPRPVITGGAASREPCATAAAGARPAFDGAALTRGLLAAGRTEGIANLREQDGMGFGADDIQTH